MDAPGRLLHCVNRRASANLRGFSASFNAQIHHNPLIEAVRYSILQRRASTQFDRPQGPDGDGKRPRAGVPALRPTSRTFFGPDDPTSGHFQGNSHILGLRKRTPGIRKEGLNTDKDGREQDKLDR